MNGERMTHFAGKAVVDWNAEIGLIDPQDHVYRIRYEQEDGWLDMLATLLQDPQSSQLFGFMMGVWDDPFDSNPSDEIAALVEAHTHLPTLKALFIGDIVFEECEISWIHQTNVSPLLTAYPRLEHFGVRGGQDLQLGPIRHESLRSLIIEAGGLNATVVRDVMASDLPALEHLELWLGTPDYGANWTLDDLAPLFEDRLFPRLRYLGLRDSVQANDIALALSRSPLLERITILDLSLGTLDDLGAAALLANPATAKLQKLDINFHFCSETMVAQLKTLPIELDASNPNDPDQRRYVAVSE